MSTEDIAFFSVNELVKMFARRELSPVEATRVALNRIEAHNPRVNAYSIVDEQAAIAAAQQSEHRWLKRQPKGRLDGVPLSVKDTLMLKDHPFRRGSLATSTAPAQESAPIVDHSLREGAVILGITTTPEFGAGPLTISPLTGITRNPWNLDKNSGGSSGGAAASVAAGMGHAALATDAGGSIRIPSGLCGVVGMKATAGRVATYPPNVAGALSSPGPIARTVKDVALLMSILTAPDERDVDQLPPDPATKLDESLDEGVSGLRIAVSTTLGYAQNIHPEISAAVMKAARLFESLGADVQEASPDISNPLDFFMTLFRAGFSYSTRNFSDQQVALMGDTLRDVVTKGKTIQLWDYFKAQDQRRALTRKMNEFFKSYDLLLLPTTGFPAFTADRWVPEGFDDNADIRSWTPFGYPFNITQQPAISVPCAFTNSGLPIGLQIVAPRFCDHRVLKAAYCFENARPVTFGRPPL